MKKITYLLFLFLISQTTIFAQSTAVDANFEDALIFYGIDSNSTPDGLILNADAEAVSNLAVVNWTPRITDFAGIEAFINLTDLDLSYNDMASLDLSSNTLLQTINVEGSAFLASLTVTSCTQVTSILAKQCALTSLDVSTLTLLTTLNIRQNQLTGDLDLSNNGALVDVDCSRQSDPSFDTLTGIDMRNGNNAFVTAFNSDFNGSVTCIFVDDASEYPAGYLMDGGVWAKDGLSTYVNDEAACSLLGTDDKTVSTFGMYPNPTRNAVFIASKSQASSLNIYSITGKLVLTKDLTYGENRVNISSLATGVYLARFTAEDRSETKKLIIN